jgi:hypothetical protein
VQSPAGAGPQSDFSVPRQSTRESARPLSSWK